MKLRIQWYGKSEHHSQYSDYATVWTTSEPQLHSWHKQEIFFFSEVSRSALGLSHCPIQWVLQDLSLEIKWPGQEADHYLHLFVHSLTCLHNVHRDVTLLPWCTCYTWMVREFIRINKILREKHITIGQNSWTKVDKINEWDACKIST